MPGRQSTPGLVVIILLRFTGPPVPITARTRSTPRVSLLMRSLYNDVGQYGVHHGKYDAHTAKIKQNKNNT
eukprot:4895920-Pyramimonas_sp.AAC.1